MQLSVSSFALPSSFSLIFFNMTQRQSVGDMGFCLKPGKSNKLSSLS